MKLKIKKIGAIVLAACLCVSTVIISQVYAANAIDTDKECTINFSVPIEKLMEVESFSAKLYKVASVDSSGKYTLEEAFSEISGIENVTDKTTAEEWQSFADKSASIINDNTNAFSTFTFENGLANVSLPVGLYLVAIDDVTTPGEIFKFTPYLISLPGNNYYETGDDEWLYDVESVVKAEQEDRFGRLTIDKKIDTFNLSMYDSTCVFKVEATKDYGTKNAPDVRTVYSNVVALDFTEAGSNSITIDDIPAGAIVSITEVYSGGSYKNTSGPVAEVTIVADGEEGENVTVTFTNTYDDKLITGGTAVVNSFTKNEDGTWNWERVK